MIILVIVPMLTIFLGIPLVYLTDACFLPESEKVYVNTKLRILWFGSLFYHQRANHGALSSPSRLLCISILSLFLLLLLLVILSTSPWGLSKLWGGEVPTSDIDHNVPMIRRLLLHTLINPPQPPLIPSYVLSPPSSSTVLPPHGIICPPGRHWSPS